MPGKDESPVAPKGAKVLPVGSKADVAVRGQSEDGDSLEAEPISRDGFQVSDLDKPGGEHRGGDGRLGAVASL